ncbi:hypothetical protein LUZ60_009701 [Juncus effusus]|nr:hypothetical protein LUZ60_009701 [Juncus effusus]
MSSNGTNDQYYPGTGFNPRVLLTAMIILIVITSIYVLLHLCSRYFFGGHIATVGLIRNMSSVHRSNHPTRRSGLHPSVISALPVVPFQNPKQDLEGREEGIVECVVCLGRLEEGEKVKVLTRCKHLFHVDCIDMWLYSHSTCPVCRANAEPEPPDESVGPVGSIGVIMRELDYCNNNGKDVGSTSSLGNSFRRMIGVDRSRGRRTQPDGESVEDLERQ